MPKLRYDVWYIVVAFVCLIGGGAFGEWMGMTQNLQYAPIHAHVNLAGWASCALFGLLHRAYPDLAKSRLALAQFVLAVVSLPIFFYGIYAVLHNPRNPAIVGVGSMAFLLAVILFLTMFVRKVAVAKAR